MSDNNEKTLVECKKHGRCGCACVKSKNAKRSGRRRKQQRIRRSMDRLQQPFTQVAGLRGHARPHASDSEADKVERLTADVMTAERLDTQVARAGLENDDRSHKVTGFDTDGQSDVLTREREMMERITGPSDVLPCEREAAERITGPIHDAIELARHPLGRAVHDAVELTAVKYRIERSERTAPSGADYIHWEVKGDQGDFVGEGYEVLAEGDAWGWAELAAKDCAIGHAAERNVAAADVEFDFVRL